MMLHSALMMLLSSDDATQRWGCHSALMVLLGSDDAPLSSYDTPLSYDDGATQF